jgi:hypothetical protein
MRRVEDMTTRGGEADGLVEARLVRIGCQHRCSARFGARDYLVQVVTIDEEAHVLECRVGALDELDYVVAAHSSDGRIWTCVGQVRPLADALDLVHAERLDREVHRRGEIRNLQGDMADVLEHRATRLLLICRPADGGASP